MTSWERTWQSTYVANMLTSQTNFWPEEGFEKETFFPLYLSRHGSQVFNLKNWAVKPDDDGPSRTIVP
jgi:hypothetical protein